MPTIRQTIQKLHSFAHLPIGWHYGTGGPIDLAKIRAITDFLFKLEGWGVEVANVFPGEGGEVELTLYQNGQTYGFLFDDDTVSVTQETRCEIISDDYGLSYSDAEERLWQISQQAQILFDSSILDTGTQSMAGLGVALSNALIGSKIRNKVFQSSAHDVFWRPGERSASISDTFIPLSEVTQLFSSV